MDFPAPSDAKRAPVWENYVIAQAAQAALGLIPLGAYALGVEVAGSNVTLVLHAAAQLSSTDEDMSDISSDLEALLGPEVEVTTRVEVSDRVHLRPDDAVWWFFAARA